MCIRDRLNSKIPNVENKTYLDEDSINDEVQMINDYVEFKLFKNIMNRNKRKIQ